MSPVQCGAQVTDKMRTIIEYWDIKTQIITLRLWVMHQSHRLDWRSFEDLGHGSDVDHPHLLRIRAGVYFATVRSRHPKASDAASDT